MDEQGNGVLLLLPCGSINAYVSCGSKMKIIDLQIWSCTFILGKLHVLRKHSNTSFIYPSF
jgi:hypothetical protein